MVQTRSKSAAAKRVSAGYCWCAYFTALAAITAAALVLEPPTLLQGRPLLRGLVYDIAATLVVYAFSFFADNSSVYDPFWCILPLWLLAYWRHEATDSARALIVMNLVWAWAIRFFVGYPWEGWTQGLSHEDWRYADLRTKLGRGYWPFSLSSLHLTPTLLVFGALAPVASVVLQDEAPPLNVGDLVAFVVTLAFLVLEAVADETLRRHRASGAKTTCVRGPWAWSRHPNYLGECGFWVWDLPVRAGRRNWRPLVRRRARGSVAVFSVRLGAAHGGAIARSAKGLRRRVAVRGARAAAFPLAERGEFVQVMPAM